MSALKELLDRVNAATGPDREIDERLAILAGWHWKPQMGSFGYWVGPDDFDYFGYTGDVPNFSEDMNAALALVERVVPGWVWTVAARNTAPEHGRPWADVASLEWIEAGDDAIGCEYAEASAATPALALLSALLSALIARDGK